MISFSYSRKCPFFNELVAKNTRPQTLNIVRRVQLALEESRQFIFQGLFCLIKIHRLKSFRTINAIYFHEPASSIATEDLAGRD